MAQTTLVPSEITNDSLFILSNNLVMANKVNRKFEKEFHKIGTTVTIRKPNKFVTSTGPALNVQDINEPSTSVTINNQVHVDFQFSSQDLSLVIAEFRERYTKPAVEAICNAVDVAIMGNWSAIYNEVGTPGTIPNNLSFLTASMQRMSELAAPTTGRVLVFGPAAYASMVGSLTGLFNNAVTTPVFKGFLTNLMSFEIYEDQNAPSKVVGNWSGTPTVNGAGQTGASLVTQAWTNSVTGLLNVGDTFTIAGVYAINPQSRLSTGSLQNFVVTAPVSSNGSGAATIPISPAIVTSGAYQTVSGSPGNGAAITVRGAANAVLGQSLGFVKDTFGLVVAPLETYQGQDFMAESRNKGLSMRIWRQPDINNDVAPCRIDILFGTATYYPETGIRLTN